MPRGYVCRTCRVCSPFGEDTSLSLWPRWSRGLQPRNARKLLQKQPILEVRVLNQALHKLPFRMLIQNTFFHVFRCRISLKRSTWRAHDFHALSCLDLTWSDLTSTWLSRQLAYSSSLVRSVLQTQGLGARASQPFGSGVNWEKSKLSPVQSITFLGMELDSVNMTACLTNRFDAGFIRWFRAGMCSSG